VSDEKPTYTDEQIIQFAQGNLNGINVLLVKYFKERDLSLEDLAAYMGREFAKGWQPGLTARQLADGMAVNFASFGTEVQSASGDEVSAEAVIRGWPPEESLQSFGVTREEHDAFWTVAQVIATNLGFDLNLTRDGDVVTMKISRQGAG
jgi:hypothetical protein